MPSPLDRGPSLTGTGEETLLSSSFVLTEADFIESTLLRSSFVPKHPSDRASSRLLSSSFVLTDDFFDVGADALSVPTIVVIYGDTGKPP